MNNIDKTVKGLLTEGFDESSMGIISTDITYNDIPMLVSIKDHARGWGVEKIWLGVTVFNKSTYDIIAKYSASSHEEVVNKLKSSLQEYFVQIKEPQN